MTRRKARRADTGSVLGERNRGPVESHPPRHGGDELLIRLAPEETEAVRINGVWVSSGGEEAYAAQADAEALIEAGRAGRVKVLRAPIGSAARDDGTAAAAGPLSPPRLQLPELDENCDEVANASDVAS